MLTQEEMNRLVPEKLREIERTYHVEVLWAVESGSRAWGFASPDSDFDVRFLYKRPQAEYLKLNPSRDVIELPVDDTWDVSGWDLDKALKLLYKANPTLYEWMGSPICYWRTEFAQRIRPLMDDYFSRERMLYHYLNTAVTQKKTYLLGETIRPKKLMYALRPILACWWVMEKGNAPPVLFSELVDAQLPGELRPSLDRLLDLKKNGPEKMEIPHMEDMEDFVNESIHRFREYLSQKPKEEPKSWDRLNQFFIEETRAHL